MKMDLAEVHALSAKKDITYFLIPILKIFMNIMIKWILMLFREI